MASFKHLVLLTSLILLPLYSHASAGLTYHGKIVKPGNIPLEAANVTFHIQLRSPNAENCLLFDETQTLDMTNSGGLFVLTIGQGIRVAPGVDGGNSLDRIFSNRGTLTGLNCTVGTTYVKGTADGRKLVVQFDDGSGWQTLPTSAINFMPMAIESSQVAGYGKDQLLRVADGVTATEFSGANWSALWDLITGASTVYQKADGSNFAPTAAVDFNGQKIIDLANPTAAQDAATKNYVDNSLGAQVLDPAGVSNLAGNGRTIVWDQAQNKWVTGIPNDTTKLALSGGTMAGHIDMGTFSVSNVGHILIRDQGTLYLGKFTAGQEATLLGGLNGTTDRGRTWFNTTSGKMRYWDGGAAQTVGDISSADVTTALGYTPVNRAGDTMSGALAMGGNAITGIAAPVAVGDAVNKAYADSRLLGLTLAAPGAGDVSKSIRWNAAGTAWEYFTPFTAADLTAGNINTALGYTPQASLGYTPVNRAGDTMTGLLVLSGDPSNAVGAATKQYVDAVSTAAAGNYVRIDGTTSLTADWDLNGAVVGGTRKILGLDTPTVADGAANKAYVDARESAANAYTDAAEAAANAYTDAAEAAANAYSDSKLVTKDLAIPAAGQDGQSIRWNNTSGDWEYFTAGSGSGTVSTVTSATTDISISNNTTTPELTLNVGTGNNQIVKLNGSAELPAVSGVNLTALNASNIASGTLADARLSANVALKSYVDAADLKLVTKDLAVPAVGQNGQSIRWNNATDDWEYFTAGSGNGSVTEVTSANTDASFATTTTTPVLTINTGTGNNQIVKLNGSAELPAVSGVNLTALNASNIASGTLADARLSANVALVSYVDAGDLKVVGKDLAVPAVGQNGQSIRWNNATDDWEYFTAGSGNGSVTEVTSANTDLSIATTTTTPVITLNTGTGNNQIVKLNASAELPAVSGVNLTALNASNIASGTLTDARLSANVALKAYTDANILGLPLAAPAGAQVGQAIRWNAAGTAWEYFTPGLGNGSVTEVTSANTDASFATTTTTPVLTINTGTGNNQIVKLNGSAELPAVSGVNLTALNASSIASGTLADARLSANVALKTYVDTAEADAVTAANAYSDSKLVSKDLAIPAAGQDGQSIRWNNTSGDWEYFTAGSGSGTVSTVTSATTDISITNNTTTPELTLNVGTGNNQIVKLNGSAELPAVSGVNLTALNASNIASGTLADARLSANVALVSYVDAGDLKLVTKDLAVPAVGQNGQSIRWNNATDDWEYFTAGSGNGSVTEVTSANTDASFATTTTTPVLTINTGTGNNQIVKLNGSAELPAVSGVNLTALNASNIASGTLADARLSANVALVSYVDAGDLKVVGKDLAVPAVGQNGQSIRWNNATDDWEYFTAGSGNGSVTTVTSANGDASITNNTTTPEITINTGTGNNQIVKLDGTARLPAVDGSQVTALNASNIASGTLADARLSANVALKAYTDANILGLPLAAPAGAQIGQAIRWNAAGTAWEYFTPGSGNGSVTEVTSANTDASFATTTTTPVLTINTGTGNNQIVKLNGSAELPAVSGVNLTALNASNIASGTLADARLSANVALVSYVDAGDLKLVGKDLAVPAVGQNGQSIRWNNAIDDWEYFTAGSGNGSVTEVTSANTDISIATTTTTPVITLNTGTGNNQIVKLNGAAELPAVSGVNLTALNASNLASGTVADARLSANVALKAYTDANILGLPLAAPAAGQVGQSIRWNAGNTAWEYYTPTTSIAADSLNFTDLSDTLALDASTSITAPSGQAYGLSIVNEGTGNSLFVGDEAADATPFVIDASGNVGIGDSTPDALLDVQGTLGLSGSTSGTLTFAAPATVTSGTYVWPAAMPASNMVLQSDNAGALSWVTAATGTGDFKADGTVAMTGAVQATAGTAALPAINFGGDIDTGVYSAGANLLGLSAGGFKAVEVAGAASSVNYLRLQGSATGLATQITAQGSDANINLSVSAKGTGSVGVYGGTNNLAAGGTSVDISGLASGGATLTGAYAALTATNSIQKGNTGIGIGVDAKATALADSSGGKIIAVRGATDQLTVINTGEAYGGHFSVGGSLGGAFIPTNGYGVYTGAITATNKWSFYASDATAKNFFAGQTGVGVAPNEMLTVEGTTSLRELASAPSATANYGKIYVKSADSKLYYMDDAGVEIALGAGGASSIADDALNFDKFSDTLNLDASTSITAPSGQAYALSVVNEGTGNSFFVGDEAADATPFVVNSSGNVGIGTTAPASSFDVMRGAGVSASMSLRNSTLAHGVTGLGHTTDTAMSIGSGIGSAGGAFLYGYSGDTTSSGVQIFAVSNAPSAGTAAFNVAVSKKNGAVITALGSTDTAFRIDNLSTGLVSVLGNGNVGIGTASPNQLLTVEGPMSLRTQAAPSLTANYGKIYVDSGDANKLKYMNPAGSITNLSAAGTAAAAGANTQIQFNNAGVLGASSNLTWTAGGLLQVGTFVTGATIQGPGLSMSYGIDTNSYTSTGANPYPNNSSALVLSQNNQATDSTGGFNILAATNSSSNVQSAYIGAISNAGAGAYSPTIVIGQQTAASAYAERMRISSTGNVGIGTSSPNQILTVEGVTSLRETTAPSLTANYGKIYVKSADSKLYYMDDAGVEIALGAGGASSIADDALNFDKFSDTLSLDATTSITAPSGQAYALNVVNEGTGNSLFVGDEAADASPFVIDATGNVGIGVASSAEKVTIAGNVLLDSSATTGTQFKLKNNDTGGKQWVFASNGTGNTGGAGALQIYNQTDGILPFLILPNGRVGIGSISPTEKLQVGGDSVADTKLVVTAGGDQNAGLRLSGSRQWLMQSGNSSVGGRFRFYDETAAAERMSIDATGKIGIGTSSPNQILTVEGVTSLRETTAPSLTANYGKIYVKSADSKLYYMDDAGVETQLGAATGALAGVTSIANSAGNIDLQPIATTGAVTINSGTPSTTSTSGALQVTGGAGISGNINAGGNIVAGGRFVSSVGVNADALSAITANFTSTNFIRATGAALACGTLNVTNTAAGGSYTVTIVNATTTCTTINWNGVATNVKLPSGYVGGQTVAGIVYTFIDDGSKLWVSAVPF